MQHIFPSDLKIRIDAQLALGLYSNVDDVIREAIDALEKRQQSQHCLRQMVQEAEAEIASGFVDPFDASATKKAVQQRLVQEGVRP